MKKFVLFDTETTGLPKNWKASFLDVNNWPRMTQLAFILFDEDGNDIMKFNELIYPDGWVMPTDKFWTDNGFSQKENIDLGVLIYDALRNFQEALKIADYKVAHNIKFDNNIVLSEMVRSGITHQLFQYKKGICTMNRTTKLCNIKQANGNGIKWPKLMELHNYLFGEDFDGAHDAFADVYASKKCFIELIKRKHIIV